MKLKKKKKFTLLEVLIALGLTVAIISAITWCYYIISDQNRKSDQERETAFRLSYLQGRLAQILPIANKPFYQSQNSIVFSFNNGSDLNQDFGGEVLGRLYLDKENQFCLALMPSQTRWEKETTPPIRREILYANVDSVAYRFFSSPKKQAPDWLPEWPLELKRLPAIVEVKLKLKDGAERIYKFPIPAAEEEIVL